MMPMGTSPERMICCCCSPDCQNTLIFGRSPSSVLMTVGTSSGVVAVWVIGMPAATSAVVEASIGSMPPNMRCWG